MATTERPPSGFEHWLPLDRVQQRAWRLRLYGSPAVPHPGAAVTGEVAGLRPLLAAGAERAAEALADGRSVAASWDACSDAFRARFRELVLEACFGDPVYGGNRAERGWAEIGFPGDSLPYGYTPFDVQRGDYAERVDAPLTRWPAEEGSAPLGFGARLLIRLIDHAAGYRIAEAAAALGYHPYLTPHAINSRPFAGRPPCAGCGFCGGYGCPIDAKGSPAVTSLRRALLTGNALLLAETRAVRIALSASGLVITGGATEPVQEALQLAGTLRMAGERLWRALRASAFRDRIFGMSMYAEDAPQLHNRVDLDPQLRDMDGIPAARVTYRSHTFELEARKQLVPRMLETLRRAGAFATLAGPRQVPSEIRHVFGTLRFGRDPERSVCRRDGRFHEIGNLFATGSSLFPTSSGFNPYLTIASPGSWVGASMLDAETPERAIAADLSAIRSGAATGIGLATAPAASRFGAQRGEAERSAGKPFRRAARQRRAE